MRRPRLADQGLALLLGLTLLACGPSTTRSPAASTAGPTAPRAGCVNGESPAPIVIDRTLLEVLPASVDGILIEPSPDGEAAGLGDACLARIAGSFASGFAADLEDFVYVVVANLRPNVRFDTVFPDWRDTFDEGACSQAGGVSDHAETGIGGRTVYIGTCAGGLRTYHAWLEDRGVLISASAVGERRLGELLVESLRP